MAKKPTYNKKKNWKNATGRPYKYTPKELINKSLEYFNYLDDPKNYIDKGIGWKIPRPKTLSWLCMYLWVSKDYISEKEKDNQFSETIKAIRLIVENNIEEWILLNIYNPTSWIFNLKNNFGWKDKTEVENTIKVLWEDELMD